MSESDIAILTDASTGLEARVSAALRLQRSDELDAWNAVYGLVNDHDVPEALARAAGTCLAHMAHRLRTPETTIRGEDENFLLRDISEPAFDAYDMTTAELQRSRPTD